ncbi:MAG: MarR family winged helix-turn-helix transcriptional regulator [Bacillota bacterium]
MDLNKETKELDKVIRDINKCLVEYTKNSLKENDLTMPRFLVLWHITKYEPVNMSVLHEKMYMANSTLTVIVDKLVKEKLVKRYRNSEDRREVLLELTKKGNDLLLEMLNVRQSFLENSLKELQLEKQKILINLLKPVLKNLEQNIKKGDENSG